MSTGRTLRQFPFVFEEVVEEVVAPLRGRCGPSNFQAAANGVSPATFAKFILPSEALLLDAGTFWLVAHILSGNGSAVGFAESVTAGNECDCFFVIHRHAGERFPDIPRRGDGVWLSIRPFGIHIDQTHLHRAKRILEVTIPGVALVCQTCPLRSPINFLFGLPYVRAPAAKTECLEAHRFEGNVAGENHEVGPGNFPAIFLLNGPEQSTCLVQVHVVRPTIERREPLLTRSGPTATVANPVRAGAVPRHTNKK